jgi:hypothetical protein
MIEEYIRSLILRFFNYLRGSPPREQTNVRLDDNKKEKIEQDKKEFINRYFL